MSYAGGRLYSNNISFHAELRRRATCHARSGGVGKGGRDRLGSLRDGTTDTGPSSALVAPTARESSESCARLRPPSPEGDKEGRFDRFPSRMRARGTSVDVERTDAPGVDGGTRPMVPSSHSRWNAIAVARLGGRQTRIVARKRLQTGSRLTVSIVNGCEGRGCQELA